MARLPGPYLEARDRYYTVAMQNFKHSTGENRNTPHNKGLRVRALQKSETVDLRQRLPHKISECSVCQSAIVSW